MSGFDRSTLFVRGRIFAAPLILAFGALSGCGGESGWEGEGGEGGAGALGEREEPVGTVYKVGPTRTYKTLGAVANLLKPGDVVEVDGNATYSGGVVLGKSGTAASKITIRGIRVNGKRPVLSGGYNTIELAGNHYVVEGFEFTKGSMRCVFHHAHDIVLRDSVIRDCPSHGLLGADSGSGSLTMEYVEVARCGSGTNRHPIYMATDQSTYPGSVFRMQHCYVHSGNGGNNVKTRAERNEIYYNWIEGGYYRELELIGPDGGGAGKREDSDVVGNVLRKTRSGTVVRIGGDGTGDTDGRYRFANNTILLNSSSPTAIQAFDGVQSLELHNNVFYRMGGGSITVLSDSDADWTSGKRVVGGASNVFPTGSNVPSGLSGSIFTNDPGFVDVASGNVRLTASSPLIDKGVSPTASPAGYPFPSPLAAPSYVPPLHTVGAIGSAEPRPVVGALDIGAFEHGSGGAPPSPPPPPPPPPPEDACVIANPGQWVNTAMASKTGTFTAKWTVTPSTSSLDGIIALSKGPKTTWTGLAAIVRFNVNGNIDARNGSAYAASSSMSYAAGKTYGVRMVVDVKAKKYSVYVTPPGGSEQLLASHFAFRTEQAGVTSLDNWVDTQGVASGTLKACNFTVQ